jgi:hypothetical protein
MYLMPDGNYFSYFPWAAFLAFGISAGSILKLVKPDQMHRDLERLSPGPRAEIFARQRRQGWESFGTQLDKFEAAA